MAFFLHSPVKSAEDVLRLIAEQVPEGQHLDYKQQLWSDKARVTAKEEEAKDVAAFANAEGGDLVIGIREEPARSTACGLHADPEAAGQSAKVRAWLHDLIVPREAAAAVRVTELLVGGGAGVGTITVMVLNVPPWPEGPVAVRTTKAGISLTGRTTNDRLCFLFPYRDGRETQFMEFEEMTRRLDPTNRRQYLNLSALTDDAHPPAVRICSPMYVDLFAPGPVPFGNDSHGRMVALSPRVLQLNMDCSENVIRAAGAVSQANQLFTPSEGDPRPHEVPWHAVNQLHMLPPGLLESAGDG